MYVDQTYVLTKEDEEYLAPTFLTTPDYCTIKYTITQTGITDNDGDIDQTAISNAELDA